MKQLSAIISFMFFAIFAKSQNLVDFRTLDCKENIKRIEYTQILTKGFVLHITCYDLSHHFFLLNQKTDTVGVTLNPNYRVFGRGLMITSSGPDFFVVKRKHGAEKYQYNFSTSSWSFDKIVPPTWSTGNREGP